jgi:hypothetical protein
MKWAVRFASSSFLAMFSISLAGAEPAAIVEEVSHERADLQFMDMLDEGQMVALSAGQVLVLGYLSSCIRETISGGKVTIGARQSTIAGGSVDRKDVPCDGGTIAAEPSGKREAAAVVFRRPAGAKKVPVEPKHKVHGVSPLIQTDQAAKQLRITRIDRPDYTITVPVSQGVADLARLGHVLLPGGVYEADTGAASMVFVVAQSAQADAPLLSRLLRF